MIDLISFSGRLQGEGGDRGGGEGGGGGGGGGGGEGRRVDEEAKNAEAWNEEEEGGQQG